MKLPSAQRHGTGRVFLHHRLHGLEAAQARSLARIGVHTLADVRDTDLDTLAQNHAGISREQWQSWRRQAWLQTVFAALGKKEAHDLVHAGIFSLASMAELEPERVRTKISPDKLRAWKFIAQKIQPNLVPERLRLAQEIEPLTPPYAVSLFTLNIKTPSQLCEVSWEDLPRAFLPAITKSDFVIWQMLATLRRDFGCGPAYAFQIWHSADEMAGNLLRSAARATRAEKAKLLPWMFARGLASKRGFLDLLTEAVSTSQQQKDWLKALVEQIPVENVLQLLPQARAKEDLLAALLQPVVQQLFAGGLETFSKIEELLDIPLQMAKGGRQEHFFAQLFSAISGSGVASDNGLEEMMPRLLAWLGASEEQEPIAGADPTPPNAAAQVPRRIHLLGAGIQSLHAGLFS